MALGSMQPLTEMSTRSVSWGKGGGCVKLTTLPPSCAVVMKSGNFNFLEPSGPLQACNRTALPLPFFYHRMDYDETSDRDRTAKDTVLLSSGERITSSVAFVHKVFCLTNILCKFKVEKVLAYFCDFAPRVSNIAPLVTSASVPDVNFYGFISTLPTLALSLQGALYACRNTLSYTFHYGTHSGTISSRSST